MSKVIKAPCPVDYSDGTLKVFLAGTIDNGNSVDWQTAASTLIQNEDVTFLNPRRDGWDSSWEQVPENTQFREQVTWELDSLSKADVIFIYFAEGSASPISLLELGLFLDREIVIVVDDGYYRKGNIQITADVMFNKKVYDNLNEGITKLMEVLNEKRIG